MAVSLDDLINQGYSGAIRTPEQMASRKQEVLNATLPEYLRQYGDKTQTALEGAFGRGMGLSTWNAQQMALQQLMEREGAANIENQAQTAVDQAQQSALANAASYATAEKNRAAQQNIAAGNQTVARQLQKMRGNQQTQGQLISGAANIGAGAGGLALRSLTAKPGSEGTLKNMYGNLKENLGFGGAPQQQQPGTTNGEGLAGGAGNSGDMNVANALSSYGGGSGFQIPSSDFNLGGSFDSGPSYPSGLSFDSPNAYTYSDPNSWGYSLQDLIGSLGSGSY